MVRSIFGCAVDIPADAEYWFVTGLLSFGTTHSGTGAEAWVAEVSFQSGNIKVRRMVLLATGGKLSEYDVSYRGELFMRIHALLDFSLDGRRVAEGSRERLRDLANAISRALAARCAAMLAVTEEDVVSAVEEHLTPKGAKD